MVYFIGNSSVIPSNLYKTATIKDVVDYCKDKEVLGVDTETTGLNFISDSMIMFQIGDKDNQYVIDTRCVDISLLRDVLESKRVVKLLHNAKFDYKFIRSKLGIVMNNCWDTMITDQVIHCGRDSYRFGLKPVMFRYFNVQLDKDVRNEFVGMDISTPFTSAQILYGADDIKYLFSIKEKQDDLIVQYDLDNIVTLENDSCLALADVEYNGIGLDRKLWTDIAKKARLDMLLYQDKLDVLIENDPKLVEFKLNAIQGDLFTDIADLRKVGVKWTSPKQVLNVFQKYVPELTNVNGKELLLHLDKASIIKEYIRFKEISKLATSYGEVFLNNLYNDNRIHTSFKQILNTGRIASRSPNMQQIPADNKYRHCFIPQEGYVFVSADYSSQELCIIAVGSKDPVWLDALKKGQDLHSICADLVYGDQWYESADVECAYYVNDAKQKCNCKEHKKLRTNVKTINFGLAYGMGPNKLADTLQITKEEAENLIQDYFKVFPSIKKFLSSLGDYGKNHGHIKTFKPFTRIRWFENWRPGMGGNREDFMEISKIERASKNTPIQGTGADMTKLALCLIREYIADNKLPVKVVMTVHDQIDTTCPISYSEDWAKELQKLMEKAATIVLGNTLLKADPSITNQWEK